MTEILNKDSLQIIRNEKNEYIGQIEIYERKIDIRKMFCFDKLHILKDLNSDIIEKIDITNICDDTATIFILYKHFFKDLGFSQYGIFIDVVREEKEKENIVEFTASNSKMIRSDYRILPIDTFSMKIRKDAETNKFTVITKVILNINFEISRAIEKLILQIVYKIFTRIKQFIEN